MTNIIRAVFNCNEYNTTATRPDGKPIYQYNYGQILQIHGLDLPKAVEIHFSHSMGGSDAIIRIGTTTDKVTEVAVPERFLEAYGTVTAYIYVSNAESGQTEYKIQFQIAQRAKPEAWGSPEDGELFHQAIEAVNTSAGKAEDAAVRAEVSAGNAEQSAQDAEVSATAAKTSETTAKNLADGFLKTVDDAKVDITTHTAQEKEQAISAIKAQGGEVQENISESVNTANTAKTDLETAINNASTTKSQLEQVITNVDAAGESQVQAVNNAGVAQVQAVQQEGADQIQIMQSHLVDYAKVEEVSELRGDLENKYKNLFINGNYDKYTITSLGNILPDGWINSGSTSFEDDCLKWVSTVQYQLMGKALNVLEGHKYFATCFCKSVLDETTTLFFKAGNELTNAVPKVEFGNVSLIYDCTESRLTHFCFQDIALSIRNGVFIKNFVVIDMTELFGAGNEKDLQFMDSFIKMFPNRYIHDNANINELANYYDKRLEICEEEPFDIEQEYYTPVLDIPDWSETIANLTLSQMYSKWQALIDSTSRMTKEVLGKDQSDTYDIWKVTFKAKSPKIKLLLTANIHGHISDTRCSTLSLYYFMYDIVNNYKKSKFLYWLRENAEIIFIPVANPWGFDGEGSRLNSRGVNLNRNFSFGWELTSESGSEPFSEKETQYIRDMLLENKDAVGYVDLHCYGTSSVTSFLEYVGIYPDEYGIAYKILKDLGFYYTQKYAGKAIEYANQPTGGTSLLYAEMVLGINGGLLEFSTATNDYGAFSKDIIQRQVEWYGNVIYKWLYEYPMLHDFIMGNNGNKYIQSVDENGQLVLTKIN